MRIGIYGNGIVGGTLRNWLEANTGHELAVYDPPQGAVDIPQDVDVAFIAVPVPTKGLKQDLTMLRDALRAAAGVRNIFIRSTVLPGTCDQLTREMGQMVCSMPEFLTERTRDADMETQPILVGLPDQYDSEEYFFPLEALLRDVFEDKKQVVHSSARHCEMAKYAHNAFGAFKVTFFNLVYNICQREKLNYETVKDLVLLSGYINDVHTQVPGPDGKLGFGGKCFPKDLEAFMGFVGNNAGHILLKDIHCLNRFYRGEKDLPQEYK